MLLSNETFGRDVVKYGVWAGFPDATTRPGTPGASLLPQVHPGWIILAVGL